MLCTGLKLVRNYETGCKHQLHWEGGVLVYLLEMGGGVFYILNSGKELWIGLYLIYVCGGVCYILNNCKNYETGCRWVRGEGVYTIHYTTLGNIETVSDISVHFRAKSCSHDEWKKPWQIEEERWTKEGKFYEMTHHNLML